MVYEKRKVGVERNGNMARLFLEEKGEVH